MTLKKSLYSLILSDEVVNRIDKLATRNNTNRSNMINQVLAEYCSILTPEKRIEGVFESVARIFDYYEEFVTAVAPNQSIMSMKSSLEYRYRPTVKYDVRLYCRPVDAYIGELAITFRTQSHKLLAVTDMFFRLWSMLENKYLADIYPVEIQCRIESGRYVRMLALREGREYTSESLATSLSDYIRLIDKLIKGYIYGEYDENDVEREYTKGLKNGMGII